MVVALREALLYILLSVFLMLLEPYRRFTLKIFRCSRRLCRCRLSPTLVLRCVNVSSSYVGTSNRRTTFPRYQEKLQQKVEPAAFPTAQSITADAVLADNAQTRQPSTEELLPTDNCHREQGTVRQAAIAAAISYLRAASGATVGNVLRAVLLLERVHERARNTFDEFVLLLNCERYFTQLLHSGMPGAEFPALPPKAILCTYKLINSAHDQVTLWRWKVCMRWSGHVARINWDL